MNEQRKNATTILYFLGDTLTSDFAYWYRCYRSVICLSVTFVHCVQTAEDIDTIFLHMTAPCLFQIALKFGLHRSTSFFPNFAPKWSTPVNLSVGDIRRQIAAEKVRLVRDSAMVKRYHWWVTLSDIPFSNMGSQKTQMHSRPTSRHMLTSGE